MHSFSLFFNSCQNAKLVHLDPEQHCRQTMLEMIARGDVPKPQLQYVLAPISITLKLKLNEKGEVADAPKVPC